MCKNRYLERFYEETSETVDFIAQNQLEKSQELFCLH